MAHEIAKLLLEHAETFLERTEAIRAALSLGMPLDEIEEYLDWLDAVRGEPRDDTPDSAAQKTREAPPPPLSLPPGVATGQGASHEEPTSPAAKAWAENAAAGPHSQAAKSRPAEQTPLASERPPPSSSAKPPSSSSTPESA